MANQFFSLFLMGIDNESYDPVILSVAKKIKDLEPKTSMDTNFQTPDPHNSIKIMMVQYNDVLVFNISKTAHKLTVTESIHGFSATFDVVGGNGKFKIEIQDGSAIAIEDVSEDAYVLKYGRVQTRCYRLVVSDDLMDVRPFN